MSGERRVELRGLKAEWNDSRTEQLYARVETRIGRRRQALRAALASAALVCLIGVVVAFRWNRAAPDAPATAGAAAGLSLPGAIRLREGSEVKVDPRTSELKVLEESPTRVQLSLVRGSARSSVVPNPDRTFEVRAGAVTVRVVGTEFAVERRGEGAWVQVFHGKVRVSWGAADEHVFLGAGESGIFPRAHSVNPVEGAALGDATAEPATSESGAAQTPAERARETTDVYRKHVARRDYRGAYALLAKNPTLAGDTVKDLLIAADVARLSAHPAEAVPYLQRIVRDHPRDERAPMAAFTLGRTLSGLGRTREAMDMFGKVRSAWPSSALGEDALLRQAEAAAKLGDLAAAARLAELYDRDYPKGRRRAEIRRYARLD
jgi:transmembrane sensor